jgi:hypothetical protein
MVSLLSRKISLTNHAPRTDIANSCESPGYGEIFKPGKGSVLATMKTLSLVKAAWRCFALRALSQV